MGRRGRGRDKRHTTTNKQQEANLFENKVGHANGHGRVIGASPAELPKVRAALAVGEEDGG